MVLNPNETPSTGNAIGIMKENFNLSNNGNLVKSYSLLFHASYTHLNAFNGDSHLISEDEDDSFEPDSKKRKPLESVTHYKAELIIYDKHQRCLLTDGEYQVVLQEYSLPTTSSSFRYQNKVACWESLPKEDEFDSCDEDGKKTLNVFRKGPVLEFNLLWNSPTLAQNSSGLLLKPVQLPFSSDKNRKNSAKSLNNENNSSAVNTDDTSNSTGLSSADLNSIPFVKKSPTRVIYQFLFNNNTRQQTKPRDDFHCPWCSLNCLKLYSLLKHLKLCHNRFVFTYVSHPKVARIDVAINECYDGSYVGNPHDLSYSNTGFAFSRNGPVRRTPVTHVMVCRPKRYPPTLTEFYEADDDDVPMNRPCILGHNRLYYHTTTCLPIRPQELQYDSEGENDPEWMRIKSQVVSFIAFLRVSYHDTFFQDDR